MPASAFTLNQELTNYAAGLAQDKESALANFIAPIVVTGIASGQYKRYDDKNQFQIYDTARAIGGKAKRIEFAASDPTFNCQPQALEVGIDDHERAQAGAGVGKLQEAKVSTLITNGVIGHEKRVFDLVKSAKAASGGIGVWSNSANDPVAELDAQIEAIATETGRMPNRLVMGIGAWRVFRNHAMVKARQPGAEVIGVTGEQAMRMTINPGIKLMIGILSYDTFKFGAGKAAQNIVGGEVFLFYASDSPDQYDPSFAKTFTVAAGLVGDVNEYRDDSARSDIYAMDWTEDIQVTAPASGRRITLS